MAKPKAPAGMGATGLKFWRDAVAKYEFRPDELRILEAACREMGLIGRMDRELAKQPIMITGSMGQPVPHPLLAEVRQHRSALAVLLGKLKLPDDPVQGDGAGAAPNQARSAANSRWAAAHGAGA